MTFREVQHQVLRYGTGSCLYILEAAAPDVRAVGIFSKPFSIQTDQTEAKLPRSRKGLDLSFSESQEALKHHLRLHQ